MNYINDVLKDTGIQWDVSIIQENVSIADIVGSVASKTDLIAVYGGDGCVTEVAKCLIKSNMPMAIIPGGTANVMAKDLGIPLDTKEALALLTGEHEIKKIDTGIVNNAPFLLRINIGIMADMIINTKREAKDKLGQLAYGVTAVQTISKAEKVQFKLVIDNKTIETTGTSLTITNFGHSGIGNYSLQPGISITDGLLDVLLLQDAGIEAMLKVAGSTLFKTETDAVQHWKCKEVIVTMYHEQPIICDDDEQSAKELHIKVVPASLTILTPF